MTAEGFRALYQSEWQGTWALLPLPALFLVYALTAGRRRADASARPDARTVWLYCVVFAVETLADPLATGPLGRWLALGEATKTALMLLFVLLGDFRVFLLVFLLAERRRHPFWRAAGCTLVVPALAAGLHWGVTLALDPDAPGQRLWLGYELAFLLFALWLRGALVPALTPPGPEGHRRFLRRALLYVALYYGLWAASDALILAGVPAGWALRVLPNQLYYAGWVPFVFFAFFGGVSPGRDGSSS